MLFKLINMAVVFPHGGAYYSTLVLTQNKIK